MVSSILDGWWIEGFNNKNGWAFGKFNSNNRDISDSEELYNIIEQQIVPLYYNQNGEGIPIEWVKTMKQAIMSTAPMFNTRRMMKEYYTKFYQNILNVTNKIKILKS